MNTVRIILVGVALSGAAVVPACGLQLGGFDDFGAGSGGGGGWGATTGGVEGDASIDVGPDGESAPDPYHRYTELCGDGCKPGAQPDACGEQEGAGGAGAPGGEGGAGGAGGAGGGGGSGVVQGPPACQLVPGDGEAAPVCGGTGAFAAGGPCVAAGDCAAGLGCAATGEVAGACRQYCCGHVEDCAAGTYCAPQPMQEDTAIQIPVCIPADGCELLGGGCGAERTCTIVRADGTTSCVSPGEGLANDPCPCAAGFVCSLLTNQCKKLCHLGEAGTDCGPNAECQGGSMGFPPGFGVCVGGDY